MDWGVSLAPLEPLEDVLGCCQAHQMTGHHATCSAKVNTQGWDHCKGVNCLGHRLQLHRNYRCSTELYDEYKYIRWMYNALPDLDVCNGCGQRVQLVLWVWLVGVVFAPDANSEKLEHRKVAYTRLTPLGMV
jgi:hypothetical protein